KYIDLSSNTNNIELHDIHFRYGYYAINLPNTTGPKLTLSHAQFSGNNTAVAFSPSGGVWLRNVLVHDGFYAFGGGTSDRWHGEHITCHRLSSVRSAGNMHMTNSLIIHVTNQFTWIGTNNVYTN